MSIFEIISSIFMIGMLCIIVSYTWIAYQTMKKLNLIKKHIKENHDDYIC